MDLWLFTVLISISLTLIVLGLSRPSESSQAVIGFLFLFLLGFSLMGGSLQYKISENTTTTFHYLANSTTIDYQEISAVPNYASYQTGIFFTNFGFYLAIAGAVGLAGVFYSLKSNGVGD